MSREPFFSVRVDQKVGHPPGAAGFTLIELLIVIGIIVILIGITIPVISAVRASAYNVTTLSELTGLSAAIAEYRSDFGAYPGPLSNHQVNNAPVITGSPGDIPNINGILLSIPATLTVPTDAPQSNPAGVAGDNQIQGTENLVLGLLGGLRYTPGAMPVFEYDPSLVGNGPASLNPGNVKRYAKYVNVPPSWLSDGLYRDESGRPGGDTLIPEFLDRWPASMPVLYLRANVGGTKVIGRSFSYSSSAPPWAAAWQGASYDIDDITGYTGILVSTGGVKYGIGRPDGHYHGIRYIDTTDPTAAGIPNEANEYDGQTYFSNPAVPGTARQKDGYILIAAGKDRIYGTADDITTFGGQ